MTQAIVIKIGEHMKLSDLGEFGFINDIATPFLKNLKQNITGIGDDCAVIPLNETHSQIVTTDMLVENTHFLRDKISAYDLGYKSLAVNLSDIAAMGGKPQSAFISLAIPSGITVEWLEEFYEGLGNLATSSGTMILGGDTTKSPSGFIVNIAVIGVVGNDQVKLRSMAKPGDYICVSGKLGDSACGLQLSLQNKPVMSASEKQLLQAHNLPRPHLEEGRWLGSQAAVHGMMDVSDGVDSDIKRIMEQAKVGAEINLDELPISQNTTELSKKYGWDKIRFAVAGGEDYCLLCTVDAQEHEKLNKDFQNEFGRELFRIGSITNSNDLKYYKHGEEVTLADHGFDHFKN